MAQDTYIGEWINNCVFLLTEVRCADYVKEKCQYNNQSCIVCNLAHSSRPCTSAGVSVLASFSVHAVLLGTFILLLPW